MVIQTYLCQVNESLHQVRSNTNKYYCCELTRNINPKLLAKGVKVNVIFRRNARGIKSSYINEVLI